MSPTLHAVGHNPQSRSHGVLHETGSQFLLMFKPVARPLDFARWR